MSIEIQIDTSKLDEFTNRLNQSMERVTQLTNAIVLPDLSSIACPTVDFSNIIQERFKSVEETLQRFSESWTTNYAKALLNLDLYAKQGWFVEIADVNLSDFYNLINGDRSQLDRIEQDLLARHPKRHRTITEVFAAHRNEFYDLTCPTIFSLVDGICLDEPSLNTHLSWSIK